MTTLVRSLSVVLVIAATAATAAAQSVEMTAPPPKHTGLFLRVTPGFAGSAATAKVAGEDATLKGGAGRFGIAVGYAVQPGLIISGELLGHAVLGPELELEGMTMQAPDDVVWGISYAAVGVNWYSASNLYLHGSLGAVMMSLEVDDMPRADTDVGFGLTLGVGYEWFVANKVGLGLGLELLGGQVEADGTDWTLATLGLAFSATYN
ncbi:MAG: outer membrane beta-barrel protein [Kofleriaceae bacterium]